MLLEAASDDLVDPDQTRRLLKELREVRMAKVRAGVDVLDAAAMGGGGVALTGVGAMELGEGRRFIAGVVDELRYVLVTSSILLFVGGRLLTIHVDRRIGASKEQARREEMAEEMANGGYDGTQDDDDEMQF